MIAAVKRFTVGLAVIISFSTCAQTAKQNNNNYDWDCHIHNIIMSKLLH